MMVPLQDEPAIIDAVVENFMLLAAIPRPSLHEKRVSDLLTEWAGALGLTAVQDAENNIVFDVPATEGLESLPLTALQAHMDMVCAAADGVAFDPLRDPVRVIRDDAAGTLRADGTSLGGDDGAGVALAMAAAQGKMAHGPLRVIFTTNEEGGMTGAKGLDPKWVRDAAYLINLDDESADEALVSTAAGVDFCVTAATAARTAAPGTKAFTLALQGGRGGHSGLEIDKGRCNAVIALAGVLRALRDRGIPCGLAALSGGTAGNAIPASASCTLTTAPEAGAALKATIAALEAELIEKYADTEDTLSLTLSGAEPVAEVLEDTDAQTALDFALGVIDGVYTMSADMDGLVESSANLGLFRVDTTGVSGTSFIRSSSAARLEEITARQSALAARCGYASTAEKTAEPWPVNPRSRLVPLARRVYRERNGGELNVVAAHAGLECGAFAAMNPALDMISIGPDVTDVHSPREALHLASLPKTWRLLEGILTGIGEI